MAQTPRYMAVQGAALMVAVGLTVLGALGFVPGATTHFDQLVVGGHRSGALLFGVFALSVLLNLFHLAVGTAGFWLARTYGGARGYLLLGGALYLGLWLYGLLVERGSQAHVVPLNGADNWLHLILGLVMLLLAVTLGGQHDPTKSAGRARIHAAH
ncbi:DUF4383 domain-containing protein [Mycobacterium sp. Y57]|uniref:DUF4383 domain-containing protein n=1 Tax=Mycolicibacterium xanthum TaxID=2796469 RepID=UPI001C858D6A|nr:DUF4383 domain-containing protein [Mycolicibacterium xanthum]MBX7434757.1 DUF4383 domain-containing protein [Mycolicibacterium xanthum]